LPLHHIIPKHEWIDRFGHMNGVNAKDNTVRLTLSQHAEVHLLLYEINQNENDLLAHKACVGMILRKRPIRIVKKRKKRNQYRKYKI